MLNKIKYKYKDNKKGMPIEEIYKNSGCKVLKAELPSGGSMPKHYATSEAFIMINKGEGEIIFNDGKKRLKEGATFTIPEKKEHTLQIHEDFEAYIVIGGTAEIEFSE
jgi:quercetin dioxygenase-like cupin family protein